MHFYNKIKNMHLNANRWGELCFNGHFKIIVCLFFVFFCLSAERKLFSITVFSFKEDETKPTYSSGGSKVDFPVLGFCMSCLAPLSIMKTCGCYLGNQMICYLFLAQSNLVF